MIITVANQKGGVGKTDLAVNLAASLSLLGKKVLVIDMDPQTNATSYVFSKKPVITASDLLMRDDVTLSSAAVQVGKRLPNMFAVAGSPDLSAAQVEMMGEKGHFRLKRKLEKHSYDYVFIDTPPSLGLLTINALAASDAVIMPVQVHYFALEGAERLMKTIDIVKKEMNPRLAMMGVVITMHDRRNKFSRKMEGAVKDRFGGAVFESSIPVNVDLAAAPGAHKPIAKYARKSRGAHAYSRLAREFLKKECEFG